jgi:hypothetical protein
MLVSDSEEGLIGGLKKLTKEQQRCHWHMPRDLYQSMRIQDGASLEETRTAGKVQKKLNFRGTVKLSFEGCVPM